MSIFTSNLEARCALDGGAQHPGFDDHARFVAQDDLDVAVHLFSLWPRNAQPENDTLLKVARDPVERIVFTFGVQADRFAGWRARLEFKPMISSERLSARADHLDPRHRLFERLVVEADEEMARAVLAFGVTVSYTHLTLPTTVFV